MAAAARCSSVRPQPQGLQGHAAAARHTPPTTAAHAASHAGGATSPPPAVYCYSGPGAGTRSVISTLHSLREALVPAVQVASLDLADLLDGAWRPGCLLLVMPGGADLPYCRHLDGRGNTLIREYVEGGGAYLGLCAGAYYASARVEFEPGSRLEVVGDRQLAFFPGKAAGSVYTGFDYESEDGSVAAPLRFLHLRGSSRSGAGNGSGGSADASALWEDALDYVNGGPAFLGLDGAPLAAPPAAVAAAPAGSGGNPQPQRTQQQQQQQPVVYEGVQVLATYPEHGHAAAALRCRVGSSGGRAVLCGTHPELHPSWLGGRRPSEYAHASSSSSSPAPAAAAAGGRRAPFVDTVHNRAAAASALAASWSSAEHVERLQAALQAASRQRWRFWSSLLVAAGLEPWMQASPADDQLADG